MLDDNLVKENLSEALLMLVASMNKFSPERRRRDHDSVDVEILHRGRIQHDSIIAEGKISVQLKATENWEVTNGHIKFPLGIKNYNDLREEAVSNPRILVLFCLPKDQNSWLSISPDELILRNCAYWYSLKGHPPTTNINNIQLHIPCDNLLTQQSLYDLMVKMQYDTDL